MTKKNIFYAQSGGATAVINVTACGLIQTARHHSDEIGTVYAGLNGIIGALKEELIDTSKESDDMIARLYDTPGCAFGSCRYRLKKMEEDDSEYRRLIEVFQAHHIHYFFYNGGGDSHDTAYKISLISEQMGYQLQCIGIPKTIDNDLPFTDNCPGFGSAAKYIAVSTKETALDLASMSASSTKVFIMEVMGRHAGWVAAASGLAGNTSGDAPHIILFPEIPFDQKKFLSKVKECVKHFGYCVVVVSEGLKNLEGRFLHETGIPDAFGHEQLGGVAPILARLIKHKLDFKYHYAIVDYLQRAARHLASQTDVEQAYALGKAAIKFAMKGIDKVMLTIVREKSEDYHWSIRTAPLEKVANAESKMPRNYITEEGYGITQTCRDYLLPLIQGEAYPIYHNGLPKFAKLKNHLVTKKL